MDDLALRNGRPLAAAFFVPVARSDLGRVAWTVRSIRQHCQDHRIYLLLDGFAAAELAPELPGPDLVVKEHLLPSNRHWGVIWQRQCKAMADALGDPGMGRSTIFVKMDADAVVVRPGLSARAQSLFASRPKAGQLGQCFTNVLGDRLHNPGWARYYRNMVGWRGLLRFLKGMPRSPARAVQAFLAFRALMAQASANGYTDGEFAIGGAYVLRREVVDYLARSGTLDDPPFLHLPDTGEDGVMTPYVYAAGYASMDDAADGGLFAIEGREFRVDPFTLKARGHFIVHPLKYGWDADGVHLSEAELANALI